MSNLAPRPDVKFKAYKAKPFVIDNVTVEPAPVRLGARGQRMRQALLKASKHVKRVG